MSWKDVDKKKLTIIASIFVVIVVFMFVFIRSCTKPKRQKQIYFAKSSEVLNEGGSKNLMLYNSDVYEGIVWKSSDPEVLTVDSKGEIFAKKTGTATITATTSDKKQKSTINIRVEETNTAVQSIVIKGDNTSSSGVSSMSIQVNETRKIEYETYPATADNANVLWKSRNPKVATVTEDGEITGVKEGKTTIVGTARDGKGTTVQLSLNVTKEIIKVDEVYFSSTNQKMKTGVSRRLIATVKPSKASNKELEYTSSNPSVASVSSSGQLTTNSEGTAIITAKAKDGSNASGTTVVVVSNSSSTGDSGSGSSHTGGSNKVLVYSISLSQTNVLLGTDDKPITVTATVNPTNATSKSLTWSSSNVDVATVSSSGKITPKGIGTATITVSAKDAGGAKSYINVTVQKLSNNKKYVDSITFDGFEDENEVYVARNAKSFPLKVNLNPSNADNQKVIWTSSDTSLATVSGSKNTANVKILGNAGEVTITATSADTKGVSKSIKLKIVKGVEIVKVSTMDDNDKTQTIINGVSQEERQLQLMARTSPDDAYNKEVVWSSSNETVAMVDQTGLVTAISPGTAKIKAAAQDGSGVYGTISVKVVNPIYITDIKLSSEKISIVKNDTATLTATFKPTKATYQVLDWSSSNPAIVSVDANGNLKAGNTVGSADITVKDHYGTASATAHVEVTEVKINKLKILNSDTGEEAECKKNKTKTLKMSTKKNSSDLQFQTYYDGNYNTVCQEYNIIATVCSNQTKDILVKTEPESAMINSPIQWSVITKNGGSFVNGVTSSGNKNRYQAPSVSKNTQYKIAIMPIDGGFAQHIGQQINSKNGYVGYINVITAGFAQATRSVRVNETLSPNAVDCLAPGTTIKYKSSKTTIATVDESGNVKGIKVGTSTISAEYKVNGKKSTIKYTINVTN